MFNLLSVFFNTLLNPGSEARSQPEQISVLDLPFPQVPPSTAYFLIYHVVAADEHACTLGEGSIPPTLEMMKHVWCITWQSFFFFFSNYMRVWFSLLIFVVVLLPDPLSLQTLICRFCGYTDSVGVFILRRIQGALKYVTRPPKLYKMNSVYYSFLLFSGGGAKKCRVLLALWNHRGFFALLLHSFQRLSLRFHPIPQWWPPFSPFICRVLSLPLLSLLSLSCPPPLSLFYCILLSLSSPPSPFISC